MYTKKVSHPHPIKIIPSALRARLKKDGLTIARAAKLIPLSRVALHNILRTGDVYYLAAWRLKQFGIDPAELTKKPAKNGASR